ncbi:MAG TPA: flippase [Candidatus Pacearchaeota archaeon]|nr:flippase [Candidatus Pacearchaeota archaeon]HOK94416.1 flippase [Candidatus Pacearchaeota archaeon]
MKEFFDLKYWRKVLTGSPTRKRLTGNFLSLSILQALNYILPLITLPYLVRVLGPEKYGLISFAQAFIGYFIMITDYGFGLSATREVSIYRDDKEKVSEIFSSVMTVKILLGILSFVVLGLVLLSVPKFGQDWLIYIFTFGMVIGNILFPVWFFQGVEKMKWITILNIVARGIFTVCIFIFVHKESDYLNVAIINSLGSLVAGIISLIVIFKNFKVKFVFPKIESIKHQLKEGWHIFISNIATSLYTTSNTFILGLFTNNTIVGYYSGAEKIIKAVEGLISPISQTIYPYLSKLVSESKEKALVFLQKLTKFIGGTTFLVSLLIFILSPLIVKIILGDQYQQSILPLRILSFIPFIIALSNIFGIQTMLTFNMKSSFLKILSSAAILSLSLSFLLIPFLKQIGVSISWLITEIFVTVSMFFTLKKKGINILKGKLEYEKIK